MQGLTSAGRRNLLILREVVATDFKIRFQGSVLGYGWSLLKPLMLFAILYVVFARFLRFGADVPHFPTYLLLGIVLWTFFTEAAAQGLQSIVGRRDLIRKVSFPKYILVIAATITALINLGLNLIVVFIFAVIDGVEFSGWIILLPLNILELYCFALAISLLLGAVYVKYRDLAHLWEVFVQAAFYATPILYPISMVRAESETAAKVLLLSPMAQIIQDARHNMISDQVTTTASITGSAAQLAIPYLVLAAVGAFSVRYYRSHQKYFAEDA